MSNHYGTIHFQITTQRKRKPEEGLVGRKQGNPRKPSVPLNLGIAKEWHLTRSGIPPETFSYRLGNRSALEWVIDQYQVSEDKRSGIRSDPNRTDDPEYIVRLVG